MIAVLGGLGAAVAWATATLCSARSSRLIGVSSTLALVMLVGLAVAAPAVALSGTTAGEAADVAGWLALAGVGNVLGLGLEYAAFRVGQVGVVASLASTEGAIAAIIAVVAGESIAPGAGVTLAVLACGVFLAARSPDEGPRGSGVGAVALALPAALSFGIGLYATGRVSEELPLAWTLLPARALGAVALALPLALAGRLVLKRAALPLVLLAGLAEVAGFASFAVAARDQLAVAAVLASQFAGLAAVAAFFLFRERLSRVQVAGVATIAVGVAVLSALQA